MSIFNDVYREYLNVSTLAEIGIYCSLLLGLMARDIRDILFYKYLVVFILK